MTGRRFIRCRDESGTIRVGRVDGRSVEVFETADLLGALAGEPLASRASFDALDEETLELPAPWRLLAPIEAPEVWAAGVTYERSRDARIDESQTKDIYALVYDADRPELFLKDAGGRRTVGPGGTIGVRSDASWTVPEPELALVLGEGGRIAGVTIGNDVSCRDIEGENPLYLPQAKLFAGACALGPAILVPNDWARPFEIELQILGSEGEVIFEGCTNTARMRRSFEELVDFLLRDNPVPPGSVLLTGTGLVPPDGLTLTPGQSVRIRIGAIGTLVTPVASATDLLPTKEGA